MHCDLFFTQVESLFKKFHERVNSRLKKSVSAQKNTRGKSSYRMTPPSSPTASSSFASALTSNGGKDEEEVCPICLLEMVEGESLTFCQGGCNNRLHQHCMEICKSCCCCCQLLLLLFVVVVFFSRQLGRYWEVI